MCILTTIVVLLCSTVLFKLLWIIRMGSLAHWSYIIGSTVYPKDINATLTLTAGLFGFIVLGSFLPGFICPRLKFVVTALSIPPQAHMLVLLNRNLAARINNESVTKSIRIYSALTLISTVWTIITCIRNN